VDAGPKRVLKLTRLSQWDPIHDPELQFWTMMKEEQKRPTSLASQAVVKVDNVWLITDKDTGDQYAAVLREEVEPLTVAVPHPERPPGTHWMVLAPSEASRMRGVDEIPDWAMTPVDLAHAYRDKQDIVEKLGTVWDAVVEYNLSDVHLGNLGWVGDRLVIYDGDASYTTTTPDVTLRVNAESMPPRRPRRQAIRPQLCGECGGDTLRSAIRESSPGGGEFRAFGVIRDNRLVCIPCAMKIDRARLTTEQFMEIWCDEDDEELPPGIVSEPKKAQDYDANRSRFYVFEMKGGKPYRQVNVEPLTLHKAQQLARIGAQHGKHDRVVTTDPRKTDFRIVSEYKAGGYKSTT
jgi:hypothetical protein